MNAIDRERLTDMLEYARAATVMLGASDIHAVETNREKLFALSYALQVIGEAANGISAETRAGLATIPWPKVIGMRHRLVHGYRTRSTETIVTTVRDDLPSLIVALEVALENGAQ
jgi:uncharacterized protein with HEPN domain